MLAESGTVVNASVNLTCRVAATHKSESDRAHVRLSDLLMYADLPISDLQIGCESLTLFTMLLGYNKKEVSSFNRFFGFEFRF